MAGIWDPLTSLNTALTTLELQRNNKLTRQQLNLAREQAAIELDQYERQIEREDINLRYRLDTDAQFRDWYTKDQARKREIAAREAVERAYQAQVEEESKRRRAVTIWWVLGLIFVPYVTVLLPYTRRRLNMDWRYWLVAVWAAFLLIIYIIGAVTG